MNPDQREQIRSNAKYLREVRPIDPDEIFEYVEGRPHPAVVREVLREEAFDLGLRERDDGTFVPVPDEMLTVDFDGVAALPDRYARRLEDLLVETYGPGWPAGESGTRLRERIRGIKERYYRGRSVEYDETTALAYALYHLPGYYAASQYCFGELARDGLLPARCRLLDVGAGVGGPALGIADLFEPDGLLDYRAVEPSAGADVLDAMLGETGRNVHATVHRTPIEAFDPDATFDVILFSNVLSELDDPVSVVGRALDWLAPDGSIVALAPADRATATTLRRVENRVETEYGPTVYAPTVRLWPDERPESEPWSFTRKSDLAVPGFQRRLADEAADSGTDEDVTGRSGEASDGADGRGRRARSRGDERDEFVNVDVQYAYGVWRTDGRRRVSYRPDASRFAKMARMDEHVTERIDCVGIKLSHDLSTSPGANPLYLVADGSQSVDHYAVLTEPSALNAGIREAGYGDLVWFENVLVLWNDDEGAYNLVVDGESVVDWEPAPV